MKTYLIAVYVPKRFQKRIGCKMKLFRVPRFLFWIGELWNGAADRGLIT